MPITLDPQTTYPVVLATDRAKKHPPTFIYRYLNGRQWKKLAAVSDDLDQMITGVGAIDAVYRIIEVGLVGWENLNNRADEPIIFDKDHLELDEILTPAEAVEIMQAIMAQTPSIDDKKKLESPSPSDSDRSAKVAPDLENAETNPADTRPSGFPA